MSDHELNLRTVKELIKQISGQANTMSVPRVFVSLTGDHISAILLSQIIYWSDKTKDPDGWFFKTTTEWFDEIGLTYSQLCTAIEKLRPLGLETIIRKVYDHSRTGGTPKAHYRLNEDTFYALLIAELKNGQIRKSEKSKVGKVESEKISVRLSEKSKVMDFQKSRKSYKEAEITTEITTEIVEDARDPGQHPAVIRYRERFPDESLDLYSQELIAANVENLDVWELILDIWAGNQHRKGKVWNMVDRYKKELAKWENSHAAPARASPQHDDIYAAMQARNQPVRQAK